MSLLNDMLKDLAKSQRKAASHISYSFIGETSHTQIAKKWIKWIGFVIATSFLILAIIQLYLHFYHKKEQPASHLAVVKVHKKSAKQAQIVVKPSYIKALPTLHLKLKQITKISSKQAQKNQPHFKKEESQLSKKEWAESQLNQAAHSMDAQEYEKAISQLKNILIRSPRFLKAREYLAMTYLSLGQVKKANELIEASLKLNPEYAGLIMLKARILVENKQNDTALSLLLKHQPSMVKEPDYYALMAALLERKGELKKAGSLYQTLIQIEPENSQYWLGYAIALERNQMNQQAIHAYQHLAKFYDAPMEIRAYAEERVHQLQG